MTVSVCIPTYNSARYVRECIASVLAQTFADFELIVSDNASTDATCDIVRSFSDGRIRLHRLDRNMGMAFNFNHAASRAQGKYVKFLCYDDLLDPTCLEKQVTSLEEAPHVVMSTSGFRFVDASGRTIREVVFLEKRRLLRYAEVVAGILVYGYVMGPPAAVLLRRSALQMAGSFSENLPEVLDLDLWLRLAILGAVDYIPEALCGFRLHPQATTSQLRKTGVVRRDLLRITETMLGTVTTNSWGRHAAWGRVAGSFLNQALLGLRHGYVKWPLAAIWQALRIDPGFLGLAMFLALFHTGILGLEAEGAQRLRICRGRTLHS
ncbi:MAG: glycosyltransferase family 2 protein [Terriglobia bacterium]